MDSSRFQLCLLTTLAVGLGFSLASTQAIGYPAGTVSLGTNPVWSTGGYLSESTPVELSAPADQAMVVTDFHFGRHGSSTASPLLRRPDGTIAAQFVVWGYGSGPENTGSNMSSGVMVPAGETFTLQSEVAVFFTLSGYYAQP